MIPLISSVVEAAGLSAAGYSCTPLGAAVINATYLLRFDSGDRYVARIYRWPFDVPDDLDRVRKEIWISDLLRDHGVPTADTLATVETDEGTAVLRTYLPGEPLGDLPVIQTEAWRAVGESLAQIHDIEVSDGRAGVITGQRVRPFSEGTWGCWQVANASMHCEQVAGRGHYDIDPGRVDAVFQRAVPLFDERPIRLLHNDPHAWNVLVATDAGSWRCTGWLDWEFAWAGDPAWDVVRLDIFRTKDIGPTPDSLYTGYGTGPAPIVSELYELAIMLWMSNQAATGDQTLRPTYHRAHHLLLQAPAILGHIEHLLTRANC